MCCNMVSVNPHWIVHHEGALESTKASTNHGTFATFPGPGVCCGVVSPNEGGRVGDVPPGYIVQGVPVMCAGGIVN
jgi:hypothetical protein